MNEKSLDGNILSVSHNDKEFEKEDLGICFYHLLIYICLVTMISPAM